MKHLRAFMIILSTQVCVFVDAAEQRSPASNLAVQTALARNQKNQQSLQQVRERLKESQQVYVQLQRELQPKLDARDQAAENLLKQVLRNQKKIIRIWREVSDEDGKPDKRALTPADMKEVSDAMALIRVTRDGVIEEAKEQETHDEDREREWIAWEWDVFEESDPVELAQQAEGFVGPGAGRGARSRHQEEPQPTWQEEEAALDSEWPGWREALERSLYEQQGSAAEEEDKKMAEVPVRKPTVTKEQSTHEAAIQEGLKAHPIGSVRPLTQIIEEYAYVSPWIDPNYGHEISELVALDKKFLIYSVAISPDQQFMVLGGSSDSGSGFIKIMNMDGAIRTEWEVGNSVAQVAISLQDQSIVGGIPHPDDLGDSGWVYDPDDLGDYGWVYVWDLNGRRKCSFREGGLQQIALNEAESIIAGVTDRNAFVWNLCGELQTWFGKSRRRAIARGKVIAISKSGLTIVIADQDGNVFIKNREEQEQKIVEAAGSTPNVLAFNNEFIAIGYSCGTVGIFDMHGNRLISLGRHAEEITAISIGLQFVVTSSKDGTVRIWDSATWQEMRTIDLQEPVMAMALSPDESFIVIATYHKLFVVR